MVCGGMITHMSERLFETYAWSFSSAYKSLTGPVFADFKTACDDQLANGMTTERVLLGVLECVTLYHSRVTSIRKYTPNSHPEHTDCWKLLECVETIDGKMKTALEERKNYDKLVQLQTSILSRTRNKVNVVTLVIRQGLLMDG